MTSAESTSAGAASSDAWLIRIQFDLLLPGLERVARQEKVDQSAQKQARRAFEQMQREGYYRG